MLIGYLTGIAIISAISALFIKLGVRALTIQKVTYGKVFAISFVSFLITFFVQDLFADIHAKSSFVEALPGFVFFLSCWLLNTHFIKYGEEESGSKSYGKAFLATLIQCVGLLIFGIVLSLALFALMFSQV